MLQRLSDCSVARILKVTVKFPLFFHSFSLPPGIYVLFILVELILEQDFVVRLLHDHEYCNCTSTVSVIFLLYSFSRSILSFFFTLWLIPCLQRLMVTLKFQVQSDNVSTACLTQSSKHSLTFLLVFALDFGDTWWASIEVVDVVVWSVISSFSTMVGFLTTLENWGSTPIAKKYLFK